MDANKTKHSNESRETMSFLCCHNSAAKQGGAINSRRPPLLGHRAHAVRVPYYANLLQGNENAQQSHQQNNQSTQSRSRHTQYGPRWQVMRGPSSWWPGKGRRRKRADIGEVERGKGEDQTHTPYMRVICHSGGGELKVSWSVGPDSLTVCSKGVSHTCR